VEVKLLNVGSHSNALLFLKFFIKYIIIFVNLLLKAKCGSVKQLNDFKGHSSF